MKATIPPPRSPASGFGDEYLEYLGNEVKVYYDGDKKVYGVVPTTRQCSVRMVASIDADDVAEDDFDGDAIVYLNYDDSAIDVDDLTTDYIEKRRPANIVLVDNDDDDEYEYAIVKRVPFRAVSPSPTRN
jgi:hypothetical protein